MKLSEWYDSDRPDILSGKKLICRSAANGNELLRREAEMLGGLVGIKCVTITELSKACAAESLSQTAGRSFVNPDTGLASSLPLIVLINNRINELEYDEAQWESRLAFQEHIHRILTHSTADELLRIINMIRMNKAQDKLLAMSQGRYDKKAGFGDDEVYRFRRLYQCLGFYTDYLNENGIYDKPRLLEEAVSYLKELRVQGKKSIVQLSGYAVLDDLVPTRLESEFLELLGAEAQIEAPKSRAAASGFVCAYGMTDELRYAANRIAGRDTLPDSDGKNRLYPGDVALWYTNPSYLNIIRSVFSAQGIPVSFAEGLPAAEKDAFMLFTDILDWLRNDCSHDFLTKLIRNRAIEFRVSDNKKIAPLSKREVINYFSSIGYIYEFASYERIARGVREQKADAGFLENGGEEEIACNDPRVLRLTEITAKKFVADLVETVSPDNRENGLYDPESLFARMWSFFEKYCAAKGEIIQQFPAVRELIRKTKRSLRTGGKAVFTLAETDKMIRDIIENEATGAETSRETVIAQPAGSQRVISSRKYNFIVGMSSDLMLRKTDESPVMYDAEIRQCFDKDADERLIMQYVGGARNELINDALEYLTGTLPKDSTVYYSYPNYDPVRLCVRSKTDFYERRLRENGAGGEISFNSLDPRSKGSFLYERKPATAEKNGDGKGIAVGNMVDFLLDRKDMPSKLKNDKKINDPAVSDDDLDALAKKSELPEKNRLSLSTTGLEALLSCPMKYACRYVYKLREEPEYPKDKLSWLDSRERGLFFHRLMELYYGARLGGRNESCQLGTPSGFDEFSEKDFENAMKITKDEFDLLPVAVERIKHEELAEIRNAAESYLRRMTARYNNKEYGYLPCAVEYKWKKQEKDDVIDLSAFAPKGEKAEIRLNYKEGSIDRLEMRTDADGRAHFVIADYKTGRLETFLKEHAGLLVQHYIYKFSLENGMTEKKDPIADRFEFHFPFDDTRLCYHYRKGQFVSSGVSDITCIIIDRDDVSELSDKTKKLLCDFVLTEKNVYSTCDRVITAEATFDAVPDEDGRAEIISSIELLAAVQNRCRFCRFGELCGIKYGGNEGGDSDDDE